MVHVKENFINDEENFFLVSQFTDKFVGNFSSNDSFYEWYGIPHDDKIFLSPIFLRIYNRNLFFARRHFSADLKMEYIGFAYQTKGFDYHADAVWPEDSNKRNLGSPSKSQNNFKAFDGKWIPNYVPTRKFTTVLYLNDDFEGGETHFPTLDILVNPKKNKIVGFGCDENYIHGVMPTLGGIRKAFICWFE